MKQNNIIKTLVVFIVFTLPLTSYANDSINNNDIIFKELYSIKKENDSIKLAFNDTTKLLNNEIIELKIQLQKEINLNKKYNSEISKLKNKTKKSNILLTEQKLDGCKNTIDSINNLYIQKCKEIEAFSSFMLPYTSSIIDSLFYTLTLPLDSINLNLIGNKISICKSYIKIPQISSLKSEIDSIEKISKIIAEIITYNDKINNQCNSKYNATNIENLIKEFDIYKNRLTNVHIVDSITNNYLKLKYYQIGYKWFSRVIREQNKKLKNCRENGNCDIHKESLEALFKSEEYENKEFNIIDEIPYLKTLYLQYKAAILENPSQHVENIEKEILDK